jgi:RNA polymerase sigma-70 factor (ECF subfamily)
MDGSGPVPQIEQLVENYLDHLYRFAYRLSGSATDAEDLVQETFLIAHRKLHQLRDNQMALAWLMRILRRRWLRQGKRPTTVDPATLEAIAVAADSAPMSVEDVDPARLQSVLAELPEDFREPLILFYFRQLRYRDIAQILDCPIGTVMSRLARAKAYLRSRLAVHPVSDDRCDAR